MGLADKLLRRRNWQSFYQRKGLYTVQTVSGSPTTPPGLQLNVRGSSESMASLLEPLASHAVVPVAATPQAMSAAAAREVIRFARSFDTELTALTKPYYVPVPTAEDLQGLALGSFLVAWLGAPLVIGAWNLMGGNVSYQAPQFFGVLALGPIAWACSAIGRMRQKHPQATPLEAQSLRDIVSAASASTPHARQVAAELVAERLGDDGFVKAFDERALPIARELAQHGEGDPTVRALVEVARFLNRGRLTRGDQLDAFNARVARLPPAAAEVARELGRELLF